MQLAVLHVPRMDGGVEGLGIVVGAGLLIAGGMISFSFKEPEVQKELSRWLMATAAILGIPLLIALHFHAEGMETAAKLLDGAPRDAVLEDVANTNRLSNTTIALMSYLAFLHFFCSWLRGVKRDIERK